MRWQLPNIVVRQVQLLQIVLHADRIQKFHWYEFVAMQLIVGKLELLEIDAVLDLTRDVFDLIVAGFYLS